VGSWLRSAATSGSWDGNQSPMKSPAPPAVAGSRSTRRRDGDRARDPATGDREGTEAEAAALMFRIRRFSEHDVTLESVR
jgi:hypothetical protein